MRYCELLSFMIAAVFLCPFKEKLFEWFFAFWNKPKLLHFNRKWMILTWHRSKMIWMSVLSLGYCINVYHKWLNKSNKIFKSAFLVETLGSNPTKSIIIFQSMILAGRDCGLLPVNNFFSTAARSEFLVFQR